jgi:S1-C subfamily serine protease
MQSSGKVQWTARSQGQRGGPVQATRRGGPQSGPVQVARTSGAKRTGLRGRVTPALVKAQAGQPLGGVRLADVGQGPASQQGLKAGDVILGVNGNPTPVVESLREALKEAGDEAEVEYMDGETGETGSADLALEDGQIGAEVDGDHPVSFGVEISEVDDGPAAEAGLQKGDVILSLGGVATPTIDDLREALGNAEQEAEVVYIDGETGECATKVVAPKEGRIGAVVEAMQVD